MPSPADLRAAIAAERPRAEALFAQLAADGADPPGISRDPYGAGEQRAHATIAEAAAALGLAPGRDAGANLYATWPGADRAAPGIVIGSHLDSVPHGGNFDGAAGVVAGLVAIAALQRLGLRPARDVTVMGIRAEESVWFQVSYIGSRGALGTLPDGALDARRIDTGRTLAEHIGECGGDPAALAAGARALDPARIAAYLELHIEQAPSLIEAGVPVGIATAIPGNVRLTDARIEGQDDHVGLPRRFRRDAAMAGAEFAMAIEALWREHEARGVPMAATIGRFFTDPARHGLTIVPGEFRFSLDLRAYDEAVLAGLEARLDAIMAEIAARRGVTFHPGPRARAAVGHVDPAIRAGLEASAEALGVRTIPLGSPASHDAAAFAAAGVKMGMVFVRNANGSHNPHEAMAIEDFLDGTAVLARWLAEASGG
ncbi:MAG: Zn-dependent hydrolase [Rhodospirillales bacterium]|nr:Zn-dependent hydrolase [Rhodospirillales bacterium]